MKLSDDEAHALAIRAELDASSAAGREPRKEES